MHAMNNETWLRGGRAALVIGAHVALIYGVATSLGIIEMPKIMKPMEALVIETPTERVEYTPPPMQPDLAKPQIDLVVPETAAIDVPIEQEVVQVAPMETVPAETTAPAAITADLAVTRRVDPAYPPASRRQNEEGAVTVNVLVDERGRAKDVQVAVSSGFPRLDAAAAEAIKRWLFKPAIRDSQPTSAWTRVKVVFRLDTA